MAKQDKLRATPKLRFPEFRHATGWDEKSLAKVCERITQGGTPDTSNIQYWNGDIAWLTPAEMGKSDNPQISSTARSITEDGLANCSSELLPAESVIISTRAPIGHLAINTVPMAINQGCKGLVPSRSLDHRFLLFSLSYAKSRLVDLGAGNTFKELSAASLKDFVIPVPQHSEQQKIADCLTSLDEVITAQRQKVEALKRHKRGLIRQLFPTEGETRPYLRFPEFRNAPEWEIRTLSYFIGSLDAGVSVNSGDRPAGDNEIGILKTSCVTNGVFDPSENKVVREADELARIKEPVRENTIIISRMNTIQLVGANAFVGKDIPNLFLPDRLWAAKATSNGSARFLAYVLGSQQGRAALSGLASGSSGTMKNIGKSEVLGLPIAAPSIAEQQRIADCLSSLDTQIAAESDWLATLKTHKQGLMQQLIPVPEKGA